MTDVLTSSVHRHVGITSYTLTPPYWQLDAPTSGNYFPELSDHLIFDSEFRKTEKVPNFKVKIASGLDASSEYVHSSMLIKSSPLVSSVMVQNHADPAYVINFTYTGNISVKGINNPLQDLRSIYPLSIQQRARLNVAFLNRMRSKLTSMDSLVSIGEIRETLEGLANPARAIWDGIFDYLKLVEKQALGFKNVKNRRRYVSLLNRMISETWLEFAFGWRPLLNDIESLGKALNRHVDGVARTRERISYTISDAENHHSSVGSAQAPAGVFGYSINEEGSSHWSARMYGILKLDVDRPHRFREELGLMPSDFLPSMWNLLPFSFIADYFVNIGDCLSAGGVATKNLQTLGLSVRYASQARYTAKLASWFSSPDFTEISHHSTEGFTDVTKRGHHRHVFDPAIDLWVWPVLNFPTIASPWINLAALLGASNATRSSISKQ